MAIQRGLLASVDCTNDCLAMMSVVYISFPSLVERIVEGVFCDGHHGVSRASLNPHSGSAKLFLVKPTGIYRRFFYLKLIG